MIWFLSKSLRSSSDAPARAAGDADDRGEEDDEVGLDEEVERDDDNDCGFSTAVNITTHNANDAIATGRHRESHRVREALISTGFFFLRINHHLPTHLRVVTHFLVSISVRTSLTKMVNLLLSSWMESSNFF